MPKKLTDEEYYRTLPKKQVGTAVLLFNTKGELLIIKPDYKDSWLVPGGSADDGESPLECAVRETREEVGLELTQPKLAGVYYAPAKGLYGESLKFLFNGGVLSEDQISSIQLQAEEIEEYKFLPTDEAIPLLSGSLRESVPMCLRAIQEGGVSYVEKGTN